MKRSCFKTHPQYPVVPSVAFQFGDWMNQVFRPWLYHHRILDLEIWTSLLGYVVVSSV
jgi:hypothetical protein